MTELQELKAMLFDLSEEDFSRVLAARNEIKDVLDTYNELGLLALACVALEAQGYSVFGADMLEGK